MLWSLFRGQLAAAMIFLSTLAALFAAAAWVLAAAAVRKLRRRPAPRRFRWVRRIVLIAAGVALVCIAYAYFVEPFWLEVTHVRIPTAKLPTGARPIRIVHISDLHCESAPRLEARLPGVIAKLKPDLIAFTGDGYNSLPGRERFRQCITQLAAIAPTFVVQGNWNHEQGAEHYVEGTGAQELTGQAVRVQVAGTELVLIGVAWGYWPEVERALSTVPGQALQVVLYHSPDHIPAASKQGVDLYLTGHTHGGQVALPFYGALVTLTTTGKQFEAGLYHVGKTYAYVNRGIGTEGGFVPRVRFCARPEVAVIELVPASR
ncbi:MAG: metallophosphoesterase [Phycisphaerae bacterium]|nr:metallophosphoesterase [Phycisphaerae bacterium]